MLLGAGRQPYRLLDPWGIGTEAVGDGLDTDIHDLS
jgi:hypothetical protein